MADDIDIEEHDVMDNTQLNNIFPCITNIKSEVIDDEENEYHEYMDPKKVIIKLEPVEYKTNPNINSNVIIFGTKPSTPQPGLQASTSRETESLINQISFESDYDEDDDDYSDGTDEDPDIIPCSVALEDWHSLLVNNNCYCSECQILFPTPNTIESHRMTAHSLLVAVSNNKAVKSTSKSSIKYYQIKNTTRKPELLCQHCNIHFPSENDLIMHLNSLVIHTEETCINEKSIQVHHATELSSNEELYFTCTVCSAVFKQEESFIGHMFLNHGDRHVRKVVAPFNPCCIHCKTYVMTPKRYNCHLSYRHTEIYLMRSNYENGCYECHMCEETFPSADTEQKHRQLKHPTAFKVCDIQFRKAVLLGQCVKKLNTLKPSCKQASDTAPQMSLRINKNKIVKKENMTTVATHNRIVTKNVPANTAIDSKLVPKSHLFKCDKCQIHFISPSSALEHTTHCTNSKGDWKCQPCKRPFKMADRQMHIYQHALNGRFKVFIITKEILARVVNKCGKCNICFDDITFSKYHASGCKPCPSVECDICELRIHKFAVENHSRAHTELGLKINDFIITEHYKIPSSTPVSKKTVKISNFKCNDSDSPALQKNIKKEYRKDHNKLYYCPNCKMYTTRNRSKDGHNKGDCMKRKVGRELCKLCGLVFSKKGSVTHKAYHKLFNIKLNTMIFVNIINCKRIRPPFPEFMLCTNCQVYFVSQIAQRNHVCDAEEHKSCQYCYKKFSDLALKLHLPFHKLANPTTVVAKKPPASISSTMVTGIKKSSLTVAEASTGVNKSVIVTENRMPTPIDDLIKKYESLVTVWNILYRCQTCDIVFDSYDRTVEHCQDHFCNMESYNLNIKYCIECKLKFVDECYASHEHLHSQNSVGIESFVIIDCDYSLLLSDEWQKVFNKLSRDQLHQVMSKSIYNEIRGVRMNLLCGGDLGSVYKCSLCNVSVDLQFIVDHVRNRECEADENKFTCDVCSVGFRQKNSANAHMQKHNLSDVPFRIVAFNNPKNLFIDEALIKSAKADDLKFVRCQYCGKLINKSLYRIHVYKHNYRKKKILMQSKSLKSTNTVLSVKGKVSQTMQSKIDQKSMYRYNVCVNCNMAVLKYKYHACREDIIKKKCPKCRVFIKASSLWRHNRIHENYPTLSYKTIKVAYFNPNETKKCVNSATKQKHTVNKPAPVSAAASAPAALLKHPKKIKFLKCARCTKCVTLQYFRGHQCGTVTKIVKCHLCGINTDTRSHSNHLYMHSRKHFTKDDIIITTFHNNSDEFVSKANCSLSPEAAKRPDTDSSRDTESLTYNLGKPDYLRVYKCTKCELYMVCRANLLEHLSGSHGVCDREAGERCEDCNLNFHSSDIKQHKTVQFCKTRKVSRINVCTLLLNNTDPNNENNWLSYCKKCDFYNTNAMKRHFESRHENAAKTVPCLKCGVRFAILSIRKHNIFHHSGVEVPFSDLNVEVMEDYTLEEAGYYVSKTQNNSLDISLLSVKEYIASKKIQIENEADTNATTNIEHTNIIVDVYKCTTCNLHLHHRSSLYSHISRREHGVELVPCKICGMTFSKGSVSKHVRMHEFTNNFNVIDHLERVGRGRWSRCTSSNTSLNTSDALDSVPTTSDSTFSNDDCKEFTFNSETTTAPTNQPSQSNLPVEVKTREPADSSGTSSNEFRPTSSVPHASTRPEVKLFKCGGCDVYFLTAECCSYHTVNHTPLDPMEYIACKICDLQFLNRSLDEHMKGHRDKTFNMDTLVVDEYQPNGQNVKIDTYSAIDRLKSKLVSTTTESD